MDGNRHLLRTIAIVFVVGLAGCSGFGGEMETTPTETPTPAEPEYPEIYETVTSSLDQENATVFSRMVTAPDGELTDRGDRLLTQLAEIESLGSAQRTAVVETIIEQGRIDPQLLDTIDRILASPSDFQTLAFSYGIRDTNNDGLTEGEAVALGLEGSGRYPQIADFATRLGADGYDRLDIRYIERLTAFDEFEWTQAQQLELLESSSDGSVTESDLEAISDDSGDGLLNAMARELGFDPATPQDDVASVARALGTESFSSVGVRYLERYAELREDQFLFEQAAYFGLANQSADGTVTLVDLQAIQDDSGDGLLNVMKQELELDQRTDSETITAFARPLSQGGYNETEIAYLKRIDDLKTHRGNDYEVWSQAGELGLLDSAVENGTVTERQVWELLNNDTDRLLNGIEAEFGTDPQKADTAGDGYLDHHKWGPMRDIGLEVHPGSPDIYVEMDVADTLGVPEKEIELVESTFEEEPSDSIGSIYVDFHVCDTEQEGIGTADDVQKLLPDARAMQGLGFHYMTLADGLEQDGIAGLAVNSRNGESYMLVDGSVSRSRGEVYLATVIGHELGHSLGLEPGAFTGIDSFALSAEQYPSIMNYNYETQVSFSTGDPFNDYEHIADEQFGSWHQDNSRLDEMWEQGEAEEDILC